MATATALRSAFDIESFISEYYAAWGGTDEDRIMSHYADNVTVQSPAVSCRENQPFTSNSFGPSLPASLETVTS